MLRWTRVSDGKGDHCDSEEMEMGFNVLSGDEIVKSKRLIVRPRIKVWMARAITTVILWTCVVQLMAIGELWGPRLLKGMPHCFSHQDESPAIAQAFVPAKVVFPPKSKCLFCHINWSLRFCDLSFGVGIAGKCSIQGRCDCICDDDVVADNPKVAAANCFSKKSC